MLRVSDNSRFLVHCDGSPFFFLADTGWTLLHRLDRDETVHDPDDRTAKGFTVIQAMGISEFDGLSVPNALGDLPFHECRSGPAERGLFPPRRLGRRASGQARILFGAAANLGRQGRPPVVGHRTAGLYPWNADNYGAFLGARYKEAPIIWVIGGDRNPVEPIHYATWRALAAGLQRGGAEQPMTFHPQHHASSADFFHAYHWLSFNIIQSGHSARDLPNYAAIETTTLDFNQTVHGRRGVL